MFPSYDRDVLGSILAMHEGQFEAAMEALLEMGDPDGGGGAAAVAPSTARELGLPELNTDEELAMALFHQFAEDLEQQLSEPIPDSVKADPVAYEAFIRTHFERHLADSSSQIGQRMQQTLDTNRSLNERAGGRSGFLDRVKRMNLGRGRRTQIAVVGVDQGNAPLLANDHAAHDDSDLTVRSSIALAWHGPRGSRLQACLA